MELETPITIETEETTRPSRLRAPKKSDLTDSKKLSIKAWEQGYPMVPGNLSFLK